MGLAGNARMRPPKQLELKQMLMRQQEWEQRSPPPPLRSLLLSGRAWPSSWPAGSSSSMMLQLRSVLARFRRRHRWRGWRVFVEWQHVWLVETSRREGLGGQWGRSGGGRAGLGGSLGDSQTPRSARELVSWSAFQPTPVGPRPPACTSMSQVPESRGLQRLGLHSAAVTGSGAGPAAAAVGHQR